MKQSVQWRYGVSLVVGAVLVAATSWATAADPVLPNREFEWEEARTKIDVGDPVVLPMMARVLELSAKQPNPKFGPHEIQTAAEAAGAFGYTKATPSLRKLLANRNLEPFTRGVIAVALARLNDGQDTKALEAVLTWSDDEIKDLAKDRVATMLLKHDSGQAREFVLERYARYLEDITTRSSWSGYIRDALEEAHDPKTMARLPDTATKYTTDVRPKNNVNTLLVTMEINGLGSDELVKLVEDPSFSNAGKRYDAIQALGYAQGDPSHIKVLMAVTPWAGERSDLDDVQNSILRRETAAAVNRIQQRCWREIFTKKQRLITDAESQLKELHRSLLTKQDHYGSTVLSDGRNIADETSRLQLRFIGQSSLTDASMMKNVRTNREELVMRRVFLNEYGIAKIEVVDNEHLVIEFVPELAERMTQFSKKNKGRQMALVVDGKLVTMFEMPGNARASLSLLAEEVFTADIERMTKIVREAHSGARKAE